MLSIVALDGYTLNPGDLSWDELQPLGAVQIYNRTSADQTKERVEQADVLIINKFVLDKKVIDYCKKLKYVCISATGYNNIDLDYCRQKGILVSNVSNYSDTAVAQHTFALILHYINKVGQHNNMVKKGYWSICPDFSFTVAPIEELAGKTMGLLGFGNIAQKVARIALAFDMKVIAHRRNLDAEKHSGVTYVSLDSLLTQSDILSLHADLNPKTKEIINSTSIHRMKRSAILVNTSRGGLIHEQDLADALIEERIQAALLDVMVSEPAALSNPLFGLSNCKITPHVAWAAVQARQRLMRSVKENIQSYLRGETLNLLN